jgi:hypothetical protein
VRTNLTGIRVDLLTSEQASLSRTLSTVNRIPTGDVG